MQIHHGRNTGSRRRFQSKPVVVSRESHVGEKREVMSVGEKIIKKYRNPMPENAHGIVKVPTNAP